MLFLVFRPHPNGAGWQNIGGALELDDAKAVLDRHEAGYIATGGSIVERKNVGF